MKIGTWLLSLAQPMVAKILIALGLSAVSIVGVSEAVDVLRNQLTSSMGSIPGNMAGLFQLAGGGTAMGMILGAIMTRLALWQAQKSLQFLGKAPN